MFIGMTNLPEAKLAREAEICYATLALVTDFDCWHESEEDVSVDAVLEVLRRNAVDSRFPWSSGAAKRIRPETTLCLRAFLGERNRHRPGADSGPREREV